MAEAMRYIELTYALPGAPALQWRAAVLSAPTPNKAVAAARADLLRDHPQASDVEEYMQRKLTPESAAEIAGQMRAGTWEGWAF
jgi:hypothetical protein